MIATTAVALTLAATDADATLARTADAPSATFTASGPGGLKIVGKTSTLNVVDDGQTVKVFVPLNTLTTGIDLRDRHMREKYLQVDKFPNAELQVPRASLKFPPAGQSVTGDASGTLIIHGVTKSPVNFHYVAKNDGGTFDVTGSMPLNMNEFKIDVPSYLGVTVKPDITIDVHFRATDR